MSRHQTWWPSSAKQLAVTRPTQPTPITPMGGLSGMHAHYRPRSPQPDYRALTSERATPSISFAESVWSSVLEIQYEPRSVFQPTSRRRSPL